MKEAILGLSFLVLSQLSFSQQEISGVTPAESIEINGKSLKLNGAGLREKLFLDLYVGALYLSEKTNDANEVINSKQSMAITIDVVSSLVNSEKMMVTIDEGFQKSTQGNSASFQTEIDQFKETFKEEITIGDHFIIAYTQSGGIEVFKNGKKTSTIPGVEFKKALFGIWLCENPVDDDLKKGMLGIL